MFRLLRSPKVMRTVVIFVAATFLIGFAGIFGMAGRQLPVGTQPQTNEMAEQVSEHLTLLEEEIQTYQNYVEDQPQAEDYRYLGDLHFQVAQTRNYYYGENVDDLLRESRDAYLKALELDPDGTVALLSVAIAETALGELADARENYKAFLEIHPDHFDGRVSYAHMLIMAGEAEQAKEQLARAEELATSEDQLHTVEDLTELASELES